MLLPPLGCAFRNFKGFPVRPAPACQLAGHHPEAVSYCQAPSFPPVTPVTAPAATRSPAAGLAARDVSLRVDCAGHGVEPARQPPSTRAPTTVAAPAAYRRGSAMCLTEGVTCDGLDP